MNANNDRYFDEFDEYGYGRNNRRIRENDCEEHDFDFCEDVSESCSNHNSHHNRCCETDNLCGGREGGRGRCRENEWENDCDREHKKCECDRDHDKYGCNSWNHQGDSCGCHREDDCDFDCCYDRERDCCEETIHCSECDDFNEDERFGCRRTRDAANSEDEWFDRRDNCQRHRERCMSEAECKFCKRLLCRIQVLDFALQEVILFLNTHPCDCEALRYYREVRRKLERLECLYERKCGPLTNKGVDTEYGWEWATCPWPWEGTV